MTETPLAAEATPVAADAADRVGPWWRHAVIYQIYVRSFADADGDGMGDLAGVRSHLPYLRQLGVDAVWLTPFYPSPQADAGYDVADYRDVDPLFGNLAEADGLIADAHALGLRVIVDIVPNHTSSEHRWFQEALAAPPGSRERARYLFRDGRGEDGVEPPNDWSSNFGGPAWTRVVADDGRPGQWYLHLFDAGQPDLDWLNDEVRAEFESVLRFWLDRGVDGFRIDVAHGLAKDPAMPDVAGRFESGPAPSGHPHWDQDEVHEVYRAWRRLTNSYAGDRMFVGEIWLHSPEQVARYVRPDELHTAFNFHFLLAPWDAAAMRAA
ncbi:MAG: alpha-amylase family glycosyl hydrolase, partial [Ilumatobacteraceae bacterium]